MTDFFFYAGKKGVKWLHLYCVTVSQNWATEHIATFLLYISAWRAAVPTPAASCMLCCSAFRRVKLNLLIYCFVLFSQRNFEGINKPAWKAIYQYHQRLTLHLNSHCTDRWDVCCARGPYTWPETLCSRCKYDSHMTLTQNIGLSSILNTLCTRDLDLWSGVAA